MEDLPDRRGGDLDAEDEQLTVDAPVSVRAVLPARAVVVQIGLAEKFYWEYAAEVPLVLKLNAKTDIPSDAAALSPLHASVADAVRLGANAVGYTLYVGTPAAEAYYTQYHTVGADAERYGMPLIVWAHYAARVASELGADVVKVNFPHPEKRTGVPPAYEADFTAQRSTRWSTRPGRTMLLVSGGIRSATKPCSTRRCSRYWPAPLALSSAAISGNATSTTRCGLSPSCATSWPSSPRNSCEARSRDGTGPVEPARCPLSPDLKPRACLRRRIRPLGGVPGASGSRPYRRR